MGKFSKRKRKTKRVEKPIEDLDLNKADPESINIATDSLDADTYGRPEVPPSAGLGLGGMYTHIFDSSDFELGEDEEWLDSMARLEEGAEKYGRFSSEVSHSEGLRIGGMDKSRKRNFNNIAPIGIGIDNEEGADYKKDIDIAIQLSLEEAYVTKKGNQVSHNNSEGLRIGGMNRGRKGVFSRSFGPDSHDSEAISFDLNASPPSIEIDRGEDKDHMDIDGISRKQNRGASGLGLRGDHMDVGEGSSMHHAPGTLGLGLRGNFMDRSLEERIVGPLGMRLRGYQSHMDVGEGSSSQRTPGNLGLGLRGDHMDVGEGSSRQRTPGTLGLGLRGDHMDDGEGSSRQRTPGTLGLGLNGDHMDVGEGSSRQRAPGRN